MGGGCRGGGGRCRGGAHRVGTMSCIQYIGHKHVRSRITNSEWHSHVRSRITNSEWHSHTRSRIIKGRGMKRELCSY